MVSESAPDSRRWRLGIRTQYVIVVVVSILVVAAVLMVTGYLQARRALVEMAGQQMRQVASAVDESMDRFFSPAATAADVLRLSHIQAAPQGSRADLFFAFAEAIMQTKPEIFGIKVGLSDGTLLRTVRADPEVVDLSRVPSDADTPFVRQIVLPGVGGNETRAELYYRDGRDGPWVGVAQPPPYPDPRDAAWYLSAELDRGAHWSQVYRTVGGSVPGITRSVAFDAPGGVFGGVVGVDLRITDLAKLLRSLRLSDNARLFIASLDGRLIAHPELANLEDWPSHPTSGELWLHVADVAGAEEFNLDYGLYDNLRPDGEMRTFEHGDESVIGIALPLKAATSPPGVLFVGVPVMDFIGVAVRSELVAMGVALLFVAVMLALVPFVARYVARPIERLTGIAAAVDREGLDKAEPHPGSIIREIDEAGRAFNQMIAGLREKEVIRDLFGRYVPAQVAAAIIADHGTLRPASAECTVLYADLEGFTAMAESISPREVVDVLNAYFTVATSIIEARGGVVTQFQGDAILATFNVPVADPRHAANAVEAAVTIQHALAEQRFAGHEIRARIGINTGEVIAGNVGAEGRFNYTVHGDAVNTAARLEQLNKEFGTRILVSETTRRACGDARLRPKGEVAIRGKTTKLPVYSVDIG